MESSKFDLMVNYVKDIVRENPDVLPSQLKNKDLYGKELESFIRMNFESLSHFSSVMFENGVDIFSRDFFKVSLIPERFIFICRRQTNFDIFYDFNNSIFLIYDFQNKECFLRKNKSPKNGKHSFGSKKYCKKGNQTSFYIFDYQLEETQTGFLSEKNPSKIITLENSCKNLLKYFPSKKLPSFSSLKYHDSNVVVAIQNFFERNGGKDYFTKIVVNYGFDFNEQYYYNDNDKVLRTEYEFYLFSILHFNGLNSIYEPKNLPSLLPDFYLPKQNLYVELLGLCGQEKYDKKTILKKSKYNDLGLNCLFIEPNHHDPFNSIFSTINEYFGGKLTQPNFFEYCEKYMVNFDGFINKLKNICNELQQGIIKSTMDIGLIYGYTYNKFVRKSFGSWRMAVIKLLHEIPTKYVTTSNNYYNDETILIELEMCKKHLGEIPHKNECERLYKNGDFSVNVLLYIFQKYGTVTFNKGGKYYGWIPYYMDKEPVKNKKINLQDEIKESIIQDYIMGEGLVSLSKKYGISQKKVRTTLPDSVVRSYIKLTKDDVFLIHKMFNEEKKEAKEIANTYNIGDTIYDILKGRRWGNVYKSYHTS